MGTDRHTGTHASGERFVLLDGAIGLERVKDGLGLRGALFFYKGVSLYQQAAAISSLAFTITCEALRPYSPVAVTATRNGGLDIALSWSRRTRIPSAWADGGDLWRALWLRYLDSILRCQSEETCRDTTEQ